MARRWRSSLILGLALAVLLAAVAVRASGPAGPQKPARVVPTPQLLIEMRHHFTQVMQVHEAVIRGDLPAVRQPAQELARIPVPPSIPASALSHVVAIRLAGQRAAEATTLAAAARATTSMLIECANCHQAVTVYPVPSTPSTPNVGGIVGHMLEHNLAVSEMLQGLLIPSPAQWRHGAERLLVSVLRPGDLPPDPKLTPEIRRAEQRVHELASQAVKVGSPAARAATYTQILTSCAECHTLHRMVWGPRSGL